MQGTKKGHHKVPEELWNKYGFGNAAREVWDADKTGRLSTPKGHNMRAHGKKTRYTAHVEGELQNALESFMKKNEISGTLSAKQERAFAESFIETIDNSSNKFIRGFNSKVKGGPSAIDKWHKTTGSKLPKPDVRNASAFLAAGEDLGKWKGMGTKAGRRIPFVKYAFVGSTISMTFSSAQASGSNKFMAGAEAAFEAVNPTPLSIRDGNWIGNGLGNTAGDIYQIWNQPNKVVFGGRQNIPPGFQDVWH